MLHNLKHNKILHEHNILLTVNIADVPYIDERSRLGLEELRHGFYRITVNYGFKDDPDLPRDLELTKQLGLELDTMETSFFIGKETLFVSRGSGMAYWRNKLFVGMFRNADSITNQFKLPPNRVIELGAQVTI